MTSDNERIADTNTTFWINALPVHNLLEVMSIRNVSNSSGNSAITQLIQQFQYLSYFNDNFEYIDALWIHNICIIIN